jgi:hypothetical protein
LQLAFDGDTPMRNLQDRLERLDTLTAECELIAKLATDSRKRRLYLLLAVQYAEMAADMRGAKPRPIKAGTAEGLVT